MLKLQFLKGLELSPLEKCRVLARLQNIFIIIEYLHGYHANTL